MSEVVTIFITIVFSAFFSGMEIAFISANRMSLEVDKQQKNLTAGILNIFTADPQQYIATMLVGNNIALVVYGLAFAKLLAPALALLFVSEAMILLMQTLISTFLILLTGEFLPKMLFKLNPNALLKFFAVPVLLFYIILWPISKITMFVSLRIIKVLLRRDITSDNEKLVFTRVDLDYFVNQADTSANSNWSEDVTEVKLFRNTLEFSKMKVRDCMVPRTEIEATDDEASIDEVKKMLVDTGFSKIIIYSGTIDNIIGYVHSSQLFNNPSSIKSICKPISFVPGTLSASKCLGMFTKQHKSIAVVVDEFGGTSGLITTEDILEEIFGEIEDEHDTDHLTMKQVNDHEWIISGRYEISQLNEKFNFNMPENDEYDTVAGLILNQHEDIPKVNTIVTTEYYEFRILRASRTKIELVLVKVLDDN
jgi:CBS domain containing-hemolysin-like protein